MLIGAACRDERLARPPWRATVRLPCRRRRVAVGVCSRHPGDVSIADTSHRPPTTGQSASPTGTPDSGPRFDRSSASPREGVLSRRAGGLSPRCTRLLRYASATTLGASTLAKLTVPCDRPVSVVSPVPSSMDRLFASRRRSLTPAVPRSRAIAKPRRTGCLVRSGSSHRSDQAPSGPLPGSARRPPPRLRTGSPVSPSTATPSPRSRFGDRHRSLPFAMSAPICARPWCKIRAPTSTACSAASSRLAELESTAVAELRPPSRGPLPRPVIAPREPGVGKPALGGEHDDQAAAARSSTPAAAIAANHDPPMSAVRMITDRASRPFPTVGCECGAGLTDERSPGRPR